MEEKSIKNIKFHLNESQKLRNSYIEDLNIKIDLLCELLNIEKESDNFYYIFDAVFNTDDSYEELAEKLKL